jgi:CHC2 zinc finger/Toprim-like
MKNTDYKGPRVTGGLPEEIAENASSMQIVTPAAGSRQPVKTDQANVAKQVPWEPLLELLKVQRDGSAWLCPLHEERQGSFSVDTKRNKGHCFGCHWDGSTVDLVMAVKHVEFLDAVEWLGEKFGFDGSPTHPALKARRDRKRRESEAIDYYLTLYSEILYPPEAVTYLKDHRIDPEVAREKYRVVVDDGSMLDELEKKFSMTLLTSSGVSLAISGPGGLHPYHCDLHHGNRYPRLAFAVFDRLGRPIAIQSRRLNDDRKMNFPKWKNPAGSKPLLGNLPMALALPDVKKYVVIVEAIPAAIALTELGTPAVSIMGLSSLTATHLDLLPETAKVVLMYDTDKEGREAAVNNGTAIGPRARIVDLPVPDGAVKGYDPCDFVRDQAHNALNAHNALQALIAAAPDPYIHAVESVPEGMDDPVQLREIFKTDIIPVLSTATPMDCATALDVLTGRLPRGHGKLVDALRTEINAATKEPEEIDGVVEWQEKQWETYGANIDDIVKAEGKLIYEVVDFETREIGFEESVQLEDPDSISGIKTLVPPKLINIPFQSQILSVEEATAAIERLDSYKVEHKIVHGEDGGTADWLSNLFSHLCWFFYRAFEAPEAVYNIAAAYTLVTWLITEGYWDWIAMLLKRAKISRGKSRFDTALEMLVYHPYLTSHLSEAQLVRLPKRFMATCIFDISNLASILYQQPEIRELLLRRVELRGLVGKVWGNDLGDFDDTSYVRGHSATSFSTNQTPDPAIYSRSIVIDMPAPTRGEFEPMRALEADGRELRADLMVFRALFMGLSLEEVPRPKPPKAVHRVQDNAAPLLSVAAMADPSKVPAIRKYFEEQGRAWAAELAGTLEGQLLRALLSLNRDTHYADGDLVANTDIIKRYGKIYQPGKDLGSKKSSSAAANLGLVKGTTPAGHVGFKWDSDLILRLVAEYGFEELVDAADFDIGNEPEETDS